MNGIDTTGFTTREKARLARQLQRDAALAAARMAARKARLDAKVAKARAARGEV